jgi:site-specific DNA-methyltransferase (cytosine-N4-specific)
MSGDTAIADDIGPDLSALESLDWTFSTAKTTYLTHGLHPYPAKYIPQIPHALIHALSHQGESVADIFCGSGTTLVEAMLLGRHGIGFDANPLACLISKSKTARLAETEATSLLSLVKTSQEFAAIVSSFQRGSFSDTQRFVSDQPRPAHKAIAFWFEPWVIEELSEILAWCRALPTETSQTVACAAFSAIIVAVSRQDSATRYVRRHKNIAPGDVFRRYARTLKDALQAIVDLNKAIVPDLKCRIHTTNILTSPAVEYIDLLVCSPPYPNAYSYHLYHMTRMVWLGMDQPKFKQEEIGSHRKYSKKGVSLETKLALFRGEMATIFAWLQEYVRPERYACFVMGDSTIDGQRVHTVDIIAEAAGAHGFREASRLHRHMVDTKKAFNPLIGKIKGEHILILQKKGGVVR